MPPLHGFRVSSKVAPRTREASNFLCGRIGIGIHAATDLPKLQARVTIIGKAIRQGKAAVRRLILPHPSRVGGPLAPAEPLIVAGMFRTGSGLGRAARACYEALHTAGLDPQAVDFSEILNQADLPPSVPLRPLDPGQPGTLILFANPPEIEQALMGLGLRRGQKWRIIGAWAWELAVAPPAWMRQVQFVSEIWAPSQFVAQAFAAAYPCPVHNVPHYVSVPPEPPRPLAGIAHDLRVLISADGRSSLERKNPMLAVRMFQRAFLNGEAVQLTIKCRNLSLFPSYENALRCAALADPRIILVDSTLTDVEQDALLGAADIVLSTHRSEGFGLQLAEAMALGKCVIATGWSGNLEFMSKESSVPLPFRLVRVSDPSGIYTAHVGAEWAEADFEAGVAALQHLFANPAGRREMGLRARARISERLGFGAYITALQSKLPPSPQQILSAKARFQP